MYPILHFRDTFAEDANLDAHTPTPSGGPSWEYDDVSGAYTCHAAGYLDGPNAASTAPARNLFSLPVGVKKWRIQVDISRGGVDFVGGGFTVIALTAPGPIASWVAGDNCLQVGVARRDFGSVQFSVQYNRPDILGGVDFVALRSCSIAMAANTSRRFICEVDEVAGACTLFVADAGTGANELTDTQAAITAPVGDGLFTSELAAHVANDTTHRLIGLSGGWAASGIVYFSASDLRVYELEVFPTGPACTLLLTVYDDDGTTPLWEVATDPNHARPYLCEPDHYGEQEIDVATGSATLGAVTATVIDLPLLAGDQDSGYITALLADIGVPALAGHRCRFLRFDPNGEPVIIVDGPAGTPRLNADYASFSWDIRDTRETERKIRLFDLIGAMDAPVIVGATPAGPEETGTNYGFDWDVVVNP